MKMEEERPTAAFSSSAKHLDLIIPAKSLLLNVLKFFRRGTLEISISFVELNIE